MIPERPTWQARAACRGMDTAMFFPERGASPRPAKAVCADCEVRIECNDLGMTMRFGIWGGRSENERRTERRKARAA